MRTRFSTPGPQHKARTMLILGMMCIGMLAGSLPGEAEAKSKKSAGSVKSKPSASKGSEESRQERERRLLRECRGRPNAGACQGYAS